MIRVIFYLRKSLLSIYFVSSLQKDTEIAALKDLSDVLKEKNDSGASAFEILHSGLIKSLLRLISCI